MTASDIVAALEAGLITENEAVEQGMVERLSDLYGKEPTSGRWRARAGLEPQTARVWSPR